MTDLAQVAPAAPDETTDYLVVHRRPSGFNGTTNLGTMHLVPVADVGSGDGGYDVLSGGTPTSTYDETYTITGGQP